jgi:predicted deacylase
MPDLVKPGIEGKGNMTNSFHIFNETIGPGRIKRMDIPAARLPTHTMLHLPVTIVNGVQNGSCLMLSAALHGDEINGVEIVRQVLDRIDPDKLQGTLIAVPIVNVFGFINQTRYFPDRRDLNRSFPGSKKGSLAARMANLLMTEIVSKCTHGIDLHSASPPRINLPQVRANLEDPETLRCARAFGAPITLQSSAPKGTLRNAATKRGVSILLYEAGEPYRFNPDTIQTGKEGVLNVMACLGMISRRTTGNGKRTLELKTTKWIRAVQSGIFYLEVELGQQVQKKEKLGVISDPFGESSKIVRAPFDGLIISHTNRPLVHRGDAILHIAA